MSLPEWTESLRLEGRPRAEEAHFATRTSASNSLEEGRYVPDVVDALVEAARELGRDRLHGQVLVGEGGEDDGELGRSLRRLGLVHRDLGHEVIVVGQGQAPEFPNASVGLGRLVHGEEIARRGGPHRRQVEARGEPGRGGKVGVALQEGLDRFGIGVLADEVGDVEGEEIAVRREGLHRG